MQTSPVVSFTSTLTLTGVVSSTLDANSQYAVRAASAQSMGIDISHVTYVSSTPVSSVMMVAGTIITRLSTNSPGPILHSNHEDRRLSSDKQANLSDKNPHNLKRTLSGNTLEVTTLTTISLASTSFTSVSALYDGLTDALEDAVDDGVYTTLLRSSGATELASTAATDVDSDDPIVTNPPSNDDSGGKGGLSDGALAGIVIGTLAGALLLFMLCYKYVSCGKSANTRDQDYLNASDHYDGSEMSSWSPLTGSRV